MIHVEKIRENCYLQIQPRITRPEMESHCYYRKLEALSGAKYFKYAKLVSLHWGFANVPERPPRVVDSFRLSDPRKFL